MASQGKSELKWKTIERQELDAALDDMFQDAKRAYKAYQDAKARFEGAFRDSIAAQVPEGFEIKFGYNFGKLSIALAPVDKSKAPKQAKAKESLADWMQAQTSGGFAS